MSILKERVGTARLHLHLPFKFVKLIEYTSVYAICSRNATRKNKQGGEREGKNKTAVMKDKQTNKQTLELLYSEEPHSSFVNNKG